MIPCAGDRVLSMPYALSVTRRNHLPAPMRRLLLVVLVAFVAGLVSVPLQLSLASPANASTPTNAPSGAYIVDMGQTTETVGNQLKPYGLIFDLVVNKHIPVDWVIN